MGLLKFENMLSGVGAEIFLCLIHVVSRTQMGCFLTSNKLLDW